MALKPEASIGVGLATAAVVFAVFAKALPSTADVRSLDKDNVDIQRAERQATWTAAGIVAGISLLAKDATIFVIGGATTLVMAWSHRHADQVDNTTKMARALAPTKLADVGNTASGAGAPEERVMVPFAGSASVI